MLKERNKKLYYLTMAMFLTYLLFLVWVILFKLEFSLKALGTVRAYNFIPFHYEEEHDVRFHLSEVLENMAIFIPAGIYLCLLWGKLSFRKKIALVFVLSLVLECSQYILAVGSFDVTDLITNTVGGMVGIAFYWIGQVLFHDKERAERTLALLVNVVTILLVGGVFFILSVN